MEVENAKSISTDSSPTDMARAESSITLVFTDMVDSSAVKRDSSLGDTSAERDSAFLESIQSRHIRLIRDCIAAYNGKEIMTIGDSFFLTFENPASALRCSSEIQLRLRHEPILTASGQLSLRIGIHHGAPRYFENSWYGTDVDIAARAQSIGSPDQIIVTHSIYTALGDFPGIAIRLLGTFDLKGVGEVQLYDADYDQQGLRKPRVSSLEELHAADRKKLTIAEIVPLREDLTLIVLQGRLVLGPNMARLEEEIQNLAETATSKVILDLEAIEYADSAGLGLLVHASGVMRASGGELLLAAPHKRLRDLFTLTHTTPLLSLYPDRASCIAQTGAHEAIEADPELGQRQGQQTQDPTKQ